MIISSTVIHAKEQNKARNRDWKHQKWEWGFAILDLLSAYFLIYKAVRIKYDSYVKCISQ
jgi:hypothetical protein